MSLLKEWKNKESWKHTLPVCPIYFSKKTGEKDISLSNLLRGEEKLTLNFQESGFEEIGVDWLSGEIPLEYQYLTQPRSRLENVSPEQLAKLLVEKVEQYFFEVWDSSKFHIVLSGGGLDSRILCYILMSLKEKNGSNWIGDIHFRCHEPEGLVFNSIMKKQGWRKDSYSIYNEGQALEENYFEDLYNFEDNVNAFHWSPLNCYHDLEKRLGLKLSDAQVVSGYGGGEIFDYPARMKQTNPNNPFLNLKGYLLSTKFNLFYDYLKWGDILFPYLSYLYLDLAFEVPKEFTDRTVEINGYFGMNFDIRKLRTGFMRMKMLELFEDKIPYYQGHFYNTKISESKRLYVKESWYKSHFYNDFKNVEAIARASPHTMNWVDLGLDNKLYNLATVYQRRQE